MDDGRLFTQQDHLPVSALEVDLTHLLQIVYIYLLVLKLALITKELLLLIFDLLELYQLLLGDSLSGREKRYGWRHGYLDRLSWGTLLRSSRRLLGSLRHPSLCICSGCDS